MKLRTFAAAALAVLAAAMLAPAAASAAESPRPDGVPYVVEDGDRLTDIARMCRTSVQRIVRMNPDRFREPGSENLIAEGETILLPDPPRVWEPEPGENLDLAVIRACTAMSNAELLELNPALARLVLEPPPGRVGPSPGAPGKERLEAPAPERTEYQTPQRAGESTETDGGALVLWMLGVLTLVVVALEVRRRVVTRVTRGAPRRALAQIAELTRSWTGRLALTAAALMVVAVAGGLVAVTASSGAVGPLAWFASAVGSTDVGMWLGGIAAALLLVVWLVARVRGLLGVVGTVAGVVLTFCVALPAVVSGVAGWVVGLVVGGAVTLIALVLTYRLQAIGIAAAVAVGSCLGAVVLVIHVAVSLSPLAESPFVEAAIIAGATIASVGGMIDVAVTQVTTVGELAAAGIHGWRRLYRRASVVGIAHVTSMMHTLVLPLLGGSLPTIALALLAGLLDAREITWSIALALLAQIAMVGVTPFATAGAAVLVRDIPAELLDEHGHGPTAHHAP